MKKLILKAGILITLGSTSVILIGSNSNKKGFKTYDNKSIEFLKNNNDIDTIYNKTSYDSVLKINEDIDLSEEYIKIFEGNVNVITNKLLDITNNFKDNWYNQKEIKELNNINDNKELTTLLLVRDIVNNPDKYDLTSEEVKGEKYEPTVSCEDLTLKYSELFGIDPKIPLSITYSECYWMLNSRMYRVDNNPAGAVGYSYSNLEIGIIKHVMNLIQNYSFCDLNSSDFFVQAQKKYCPDNDGSWITHNLHYYKNLSEDYYTYQKQREQKVLTKR